MLGQVYRSQLEDRRRVVGSVVMSGLTVGDVVVVALAQWSMGGNERAAR